MERTIAEIEVEIRDGQNQWIRLQNNIVNMSEQHSQQLNEIHLARQRKYNFDIVTLMANPFYFNRTFNNRTKTEENRHRIVRRN